MIAQDLIDKLNALPKEWKDKPILFKSGFDGPVFISGDVELFEGNNGWVIVE